MEFLDATSAPERSSSGVISGGILSRYGYCFSYCCTKKASSEVEPDRLEAEVVVALHYVACSRTPTALNLSASTEKSKGWLLGTENTLL